MNRIAELREERNTIVVEARKILDKADAEKRAVTGEERAKYDELMGKQADLKKQIEERDAIEQVERELAVREVRAKPAAAGEKTKAELQMDGFRNWMRNEVRGGAEGIAEFRDLQANTNASGGYIVPPEQFVKDLIVKLKDLVWVRKYATVIPIAQAASLGIPTLEAEPNDADWTSEISTGNSDTGMAFGKRKLEPHALAKNLKVSRELLRMAAINPEGVIQDRFSYKFGVTEEKAFLTGSGAQQPLGLFTASANGIDTTRDISTGNTTTGITFDGLMANKYGIKAQYRNKNCSWLFSRSAVLQIAQLKDNYGRYLWQPSTQVDQPDTILGFPVIESEYVPATFTTGKYVGLFGDLSFYWIADAYDMEMQRLEELYAATNQVGFIMRKKTDGMPVLAEAFARVKLA